MKRLSFSLIITLIFMTSCAEGGEYAWDGTMAKSCTRGQGTEENPYIVMTGGQLLHALWYGEGFVKLGADINLNNHNWKSFDFNGVLDGNGHTISNLCIDRPLDEYCGLIGRLGNDGGVKDLTIRGVYIKGRNYVGTLAGKAGDNCWFSNCHVIMNEGSVIGGEEYVGGIAGYGSYFSDCSVETVSEGAFISGTQNIGGIAGYCNNGFVGCKVDVDLEGDDNVGGICGYGYDAVAVACYSNGNIECRSGSAIGGIWGDVYYVGTALSYTTMQCQNTKYSPLNGTIIDCYSIYDTDNIAQKMYEAYSDYAQYWNFDNKWIWAGTVSGKEKSVECPRLAWE